MDPVTRNILADAMLSHPTLRYVLSGGAAPVDFITPLAGSTNAAPPGKRTTQDDVAPGDVYQQMVEAATGRNASMSLLAAAAAANANTVSTVPVYEPETILGYFLRPIELMSDGTIKCLKVDMHGFIPAGKPEFYYARKELSPSQINSPSDQGQPGSVSGGTGTGGQHLFVAPSSVSPGGGPAPQGRGHKKRVTTDDVDSKAAQQPKKRRQVPIEPVPAVDDRQLDVLEDMYRMWGGRNFSLRSSVRVRELPGLIRQMVELMEKHGVTLADLHTWSTQHQQWCKQNGHQEPFTFNRGLFGSRITQILFARLSEFYTTVGLSQEDTVGKWITCIEKQGKPYEEHQAAMGAQYPSLKAIMGKDARTKLKVMSSAGSMAEADAIAATVLGIPTLARAAAAVAAAGGTSSGGD